MGLHNCSTMESNWQNCEEIRRDNIDRPVHHRFARSAENIAIVSESVPDDTILQILVFFRN